MLPTSRSSIMAQHVAKGWTSPLAFIVLALFGTAADGAAISIRQLGEQQLRLATVGYRLGTASSHVCKSPHVQTGLVLHDLTQYSASVRPAVSAAFSLHDGIGILEVVPQSVGEQAGLLVDDEVIEVNGKSVEAPQAVANARQSYRRMGAFLDGLAWSLRAGSVDLLVRRRGQLLHARLTGQPSCGGDAFLIDSSNLNAWSDGTKVFVTTAMMGLASDDDELAFVVAHEMAHNILGQSSRQDARGLLGLFGFGAARARREETYADELAVPLTSAGGFRPEGAVELLASARRALWWNISLDHPGFGERIRHVTAAIAHLPSKT
jgi:hypothetical protein